MRVAGAKELSFAVCDTWLVQLCTASWVM